MGRDDHGAAKAVDMLDLLIEFFDDGERWIKGKLECRKSRSANAPAHHLARSSPLPAVPWHRF
jgi:hypothetical protein